MHSTDIYFITSDPTSEVCVEILIIIIRLLNYNDDLYYCILVYTNIQCILYILFIGNSIVLTIQRLMTNYDDDRNRTKDSGC